MRTLDVAAIRQEILAKYRQLAISPDGLFPYPTGGQSALSLGYPTPLVSTIPPQVRARFVGVGNPFMLGPIRPGDVVLDLGCGAGLDAFVAAALVGRGGSVVGVDSSPELLAIAAEGLTAIGGGRVAFHRAWIEALPFPDSSFDIALSNGVLNLVPDKPVGLREIFRVLRPGGRLQACDIGLVGEESPPDKAPWSD